MPKVGKNKDAVEFDYTPEGIEKAEAYSKETGLPITDARERNETYAFGGRIPPDASPFPSPSRRSPYSSPTSAQVGGQELYPTPSPSGSLPRIQDKSPSDPTPPIGSGSARRLNPRLHEDWGTDDWGPPPHDWGTGGKVKKGKKGKKGY